MESNDCEENETEELNSILKNAFGESSDSDVDEKAQAEELKNPGSGAVGDFLFPDWDRIDQISGLWLCRDFLSPDEQSKLLSAIHQEGWFSEASGNQAMRFGDLPGWALELSHTIREAIFLNNISYEFEGVEACDNEKESDLFPSDILWREPLFDQLIVNKYEPGYMCTC